MRPRLDILISPGFILGLVLLLANDFVLKGAWPGFVTGKLSDFVGLFVFALLWATFLPRHASKVYVVTAVAWVLWKSPASQPAIDAWNHTTPLQIARVVDYTDLLGLVVLPASYAYFARACAAASVPLDALRRSCAALAMMMALFAFGATSYVTDDVRYIRKDSGVYHFYEPAGPIIERFNALELDYNGQILNPDLGGDFEESFWIAVPSELCGTHFEVRIKIRTLYETDIELQQLRERCDDEAESADYVRAFEQSIIDPLAESQPTPEPSAQVKRRFVFADSDGASYVFPVSRDELITRIEERVRLPDDADNLDRPSNKIDSVGYWLDLPSSLCGPFVSAFVELETVGAELSELILKRIHPECREVAAARLDYKADFEREVIDLIRRP